MQEEILDLVNENDEVIGQMPRSEVYAKDLKNIRAVHCFIKNSGGKIWIPVRSKNKKSFPLAFDISCSGCVSSGEDYLCSFKRELSEELNMDLENFKYKVLGKCSPKDGLYSFQTVYEIESDATPNYNKDDFDGYEWLYPEEIIKKIEEGMSAKGGMDIIIKKFYL